MRFLSVAFVLAFVALLLLHAKDYYLAPLYGAMFAVGGAAFEKVMGGPFQMVAARPLSGPDNAIRQTPMSMELACGFILRILFCFVFTVVPRFRKPTPWTTALPV